MSANKLVISGHGFYGGKKYNETTKEVEEIWEKSVKDAQFFKKKGADNLIKFLSDKGISAFIWSPYNESSGFYELEKSRKYNPFSFHLELPDLFEWQIVPCKLSDVDFLKQGKDSKMRREKMEMEKIAKEKNNELIALMEEFVENLKIKNS